MKILVFAMLAFYSVEIFAANDFLKLFKHKKPVIAAIMVEGELSSKDAVKKAKQWSLDQARIATDGDVDGLLLEFRGGGIMDRDIPAKKLSAMVEITKSVIGKHPKLVIGVEILWHFPGSTLKLAQQSGAKFVRLDFFSDKVKAEGKVVPIDPKGLIKYRKTLKAEHIALLTDIQVKYSKMLDPKISLQQSAKTARSYGSDGVIISGSKSGSAPDIQRLSQARQTINEFPIIIGSGFSLENAPQFVPRVDAIIVGTSISEKTGGPLVPEKVKNLMTYMKDARKLL